MTPEELKEALKRIAAEINRLKDEQGRLSERDAAMRVRLQKRYADESDADYSKRQAAIDASPRFAGASAYAGLAEEATTETAKQIIADILAEMPTVTGNQAAVNYARDLIAATLLNPSVRPDDPRIIGPISRTVFNAVIPRNREIALFPFYPTRASQETLAIQYLLDTTELGRSDFEPPVGEPSADMAEMLDRLKAGLPNIMNQAVRKTGAGLRIEGPENLFEHFTEDQFRDIIVPPEERAAFEFGERAEAVGLDAQGRLKPAEDIVDRALLDAGIGNTQAELGDDEDAHNDFRNSLITELTDAREQLERLGLSPEQIAAQLLSGAETAIERDRPGHIEDFNARTAEVAEEKARADLAEGDKDLVAAGKKVLNQVGLQASQLTANDLQMVYGSIAEAGSEGTLPWVKAFAERGLFRQAKEMEGLADPNKARQAVERSLFGLGLSPDLFTDERLASFAQIASSVGPDGLLAQLTANPERIQEYINEKRSADVLQGGVEGLKDTLQAMGLRGEGGGLTQAGVVLSQAGDRILEQIRLRPGTDPDQTIQEVLGLQEPSQPRGTQTLIEVGPDEEMRVVEGEVILPGESRVVELDVPQERPEPPRGVSLPEFSELARLNAERFNVARPPAVPTSAAASLSLQTGQLPSLSGILNPPMVSFQQLQDERYKFPEGFGPTTGGGFSFGQEFEDYITQRAGEDFEFRDYLREQAGHFLPEFTRAADETRASKLKALQSRAQSEERKGVPSSTLQHLMGISIPAPARFLPEFQRHTGRFREQFEALPEFAIRERHLADTASAKAERDRTRQIARVQEEGRAAETARRRRLRRGGRARHSA